MATAVVNAAADAAWPDGNEEDVGGLGTVRQWGSGSGAGRRRGSSGLATALVRKLAAPMDSTPRNAARRVTLFREASAEAMANHSTLWLAAVVSTFRPVSAGERGILAIRRSI